MHDVYVDFKVGQRWKSRMGHRFIIKEIHEEDEYALVCISLDSGKKQLFDEDGYACAGWPGDNDLVELIE